MLELRAVVRTYIQDRFPRLVLEETFVDLVCDPGEMIRQRSRHPGEIGMVAEHDLLLDRVVELGGAATATIEHPQGIIRFVADVFFLEEIVAPGLLAQIDDEFQIIRFANTADHRSPHRS